MNRRPKVRIPAEFLKKSTPRTIAMIAHRLVIFVVPLGTMTWLGNEGVLSPGPLAAITILLGAFGGIGLQLLGLVGHEGGHFNLHSDRLTSARLGVLVSALVPMHFDVGFGVSHNLHHRYTNTAKDPDLALFSPFKTLLSRIFLARLRASREYLRRTLSLAFRDASSVVDGSLSAEDFRSLARLNILISTLVFGLYVSLAFTFGPHFFVALGTCYFFAVMISGIRPFLEHLGTDDKRETSARTWSSPILDYVFGGINFHQAHHLCPGVPAYRIKAFHAWLQTSTVSQPAELSTYGLLETAKVLTSGQEYGQAPVNRGDNESR